MQKHTQGEWVIGKAIHTTGIVPIRANGLAICHVTHPKWGYDDTIQDEQECAANARLIAAAPDLLEALQIAEVIAARSVTAGTAPRGALNTIRAALAKAQP